MTPIEAARNTFTGGKAKDHGYTNISIDPSTPEPNKDGSYSRVVINFNKP